MPLQPCGAPKSVNSTTRGHRVPACSNGSDCDWLRRGNCSYFHPRVGVQKPWVRDQGGQATRSQVSRSQDFRQESRSLGPRQESRSQGPRQERRSQGPIRESRSPEPRQQSRGQGPHQERRGQGPHQENRGQGSHQESRGLVQPDRLPCKFDGRCERIPNCPWIHSLEDFPPLQRRSNKVLRNLSQQRRH